MRKTPKTELDSRIKRLQDLMSQNQIDGAVILQSPDLFYFTGTAQRAHLFVPVTGSPMLFVSKSYPRAREESALDEITQLESLKNLPDLLRSKGLPPNAKLGFELDVMPANIYFRYKKMFEQNEIVDISPLIRTVRMIKSPYELEIFNDAARLCKQTFEKVAGLIKEGMTEVELAGLVEAEFRRGGHQGLVRMRAFNQALFFGHLLSGANMTVPSCLESPTGGPGMNPSFPQSSGSKIIKRHEPILVDYVGIIDGYMVDMTRIFSLGDIPEKFHRAQAAALAIQDEVTRRAKPGTVCADLYDLSFAVAEEHGLRDHFMGYRDPLAFVGHGVGLELDEWPVLARGFKMKLEENMVFALEPKFHFPGEGVAGIENTFVVTQEGAVKISDFPDEIVIL